VVITINSVKSEPVRGIHTAGDRLEGLWISTLSGNNWGVNLRVSLIIGHQEGCLTPFEHRTRASRERQLNTLLVKVVGVTNLGQTGLGATEPHVAQLLNGINIVIHGWCRRSLFSWWSQELRTRRWRRWRFLLLLLFPEW
jgi:hypothetical protein